MMAGVGAPFRMAIVIILVAGLLAGLESPATASDPRQLEMPTPGLRHAPFTAGMVVEPVEPQVVRLVDDGAGHDLTDPRTFEDAKPASLLSIGVDGSVWLTSRGGFIRLGAPGEIPDPLDTFLAKMAVGPDGSLWIADGDHGSSIGHWHTGTWTIFDLAPDAWIVWLEATPEGGLEFAWRDETSLVFGSIKAGDDGWAIASDSTPLALGSPDGPIVVARTLDGGIWVAEGLWWQAEQRREPGRLWALDGRSWREVEPPGIPRQTQPTEMVLDGSGSLWVTWRQVTPGSAGTGPDGYLTRREADGTWTTFDGVVGGALVADDHGIWLTPEGWCSGYARFDGDRPSRYLDGLCLRPPSVSPAGDIWLFGHRRDRSAAGVYVIEPGP